MGSKSCTRKTCPAPHQLPPKSPCWAFVPLCFLEERGTQRWRTQSRPPRSPPSGVALCLLLDFPPFSLPPPSKLTKFRPPNPGPHTTTGANTQTCQPQRRQPKLPSPSSQRGGTPRTRTDLCEVVVALRCVACAPVTAAARVKSCRDAVRARAARQQQQQQQQLVWFGSATTNHDEARPCGGGGQARR